MDPACASVFSSGGVAGDEQGIGKRPSCSFLTCEEPWYHTPVQAHVPLEEGWRFVVPTVPVRSIRARPWACRWRRQSIPALLGRVIVRAAAVRAFLAAWTAGGRHEAGLVCNAVGAHEIHAAQGRPSARRCRYRATAPALHRPRMLRSVEDPGFGCMNSTPEEHSSRCARHSVGLHGRESTVPAADARQLRSQLDAPRASGA